MAENNQEVRLAASVARTATANFDGPLNDNFRGIDLIIDVTAISATPSVVFTIQNRDPVSGVYYTVLASAAITATGTTVLRAFPGATAAANTVANFALGRTWRVNATHGDADSITYTLGAVLYR